MKIIDFIEKYFNMMITKYSIILTLLFIVLAIASFILIKTKKDLIIYINAITLIFANFMALIPLVFFDYNFYFTEPVIGIKKLIYLIPLFMLISYINKNIQNKKIFSSLIIAMLLIALCKMIYDKKYDLFDSKGILATHRLGNIHRKEMFYKYLKITRYADLTNTKPTFYVELQNADDFADFIEYFDVNIEKCFDKNEWYINIFKIYEITYNKKYEAGFCNTKKESEMMKKFEETGGTFTQEEIEKSDFSKLKNDNFVLNKTKKI